MQEFAASQRVEAGQRLVEDEDPGMGAEGEGQHHLGLLSAR